MSWSVTASAQSLAYISSNNGIFVVDLGTNTVKTTIPTASPTYGVAFTPDGARAYFTNPNSNSVTVVDTTKNAVIATIPVAARTFGIAINTAGTRAYVTNAVGTNSVSVIDTATNTVVDNVPVGDDPIALAIHPDGSRVYTANFAPFNGEVSVIDTATDKVIDKMGFIGGFTQGIAFHPDGTRFYLSSIGPFNISKVIVVDTSLKTVIAEVPTPDFVQSIPTPMVTSSDGSRLYVAAGGRVFVIDTASNVVIAVVPVGQIITGLALGPGGTRVYAVDTLGLTVSAIDTNKNTVVDNILLRASAFPAGFGQFILPRAVPTLAQPTNVKANQVSDASGTQIRLTWDYQNGTLIDGFRVERVPPSSFDSLSSPALSTGSELSVHPDPSVCQSGHCTFVDRSFVTADNSALVPFATYSYRVRAFQGSTDSDPSNVATCFQLRLETDNNNATMQATFTPLATLTPNLNSLQQAAQLFHFDHFNWVSLMTHVPSVATSGLIDHNLNLLSPPPPPLIDPPLGGWLYLAADSLPYYWNEEAGFDPAYFLQQNTTNLATEFRDTPYSILLSVSSDYFQFHTLLVGVEGAIGATPPRFHNLASFFWSSNFSKLSGGITDIRFSNIAPPSDPGPGGVFNVKTINDADLPLDVRQVLIQAGAQGVSTVPKVDTDAPTTAAFLFGPKGTNGWYTGPVTATLIATDIDGPSDVASTTYNIDGGPVLAYAGSFVISGDGIHSIQFGSTDQAGNAETPRPSQTIKIDATPPSIGCVSNPSTLWPPNGKTVSVMVSGMISDSTSGVDGGSVGFAITDSEGQIQTAGSITLGSSGNYSFPVSLVASRFGSDKNGRKYTIVVSARDNAGNINSCSTVVTVPHDQGQ